MDLVGVDPNDWTCSEDLGLGFLTSGGDGEAYRTFRAFARSFDNIGPPKRHHNRFHTSMSRLQEKRVFLANLICDLDVVGVRTILPANLGPGSPERGESATIQSA